MKRSQLLIPLLAALFCPGQPLAAADVGLQATLKQMADLLAAQQKQLDQQARELKEQRELIRQLQGEQPAEKLPVVAQKEEPPPSPSRIKLRPRMMPKWLPLRIPALGMTIKRRRIRPRKPW